MVKARILRQEAGIIDKKSSPGGRKVENGGGMYVRAHGPRRHGEHGGHRDDRFDRYTSVSPKLLLRDLCDLRVSVVSCSTPPPSFLMLNIAEQLRWRDHRLSEEVIKLFLLIVLNICVIIA